MNENYKIGMDLGNTGTTGYTTIEVIKKTSDIEMKVKEFFSTLTEDEFKALEKNYIRYVNEERFRRNNKNYEVGMCFMDSSSICDEYYKILSVNSEKCQLYCEVIRINNRFISMDEYYCYKHQLGLKISPENYENVKRIAQEYICEKDEQIRKAIKKIKDLPKRC